MYLDASSTQSYPGTGKVWHNLAFRDSDAVFEVAPGFDSANGALVFSKNTDAGIDIDALGFEYKADFAIELVVKPGATQAQYAGIFGDHTCGGRDHTGMVMQQSGARTNSYYFACE